jgi:hypothetical protein
LERAVHHSTDVNEWLPSGLIGANSSVAKNFVEAFATDARFHADGSKARRAPDGRVIESPAV